MFFILKNIINKQLVRIKDEFFVVFIDIKGYFVNIYFYGDVNF